ncbi:MAG: acetyltransferase [Rhodocyclaceae bacterium]
MVQPIALISADKEIAELSRNVQDAALIGFFDPREDAVCFGLMHLGPDSNWSAIRNRFPGLRVVLALDLPARKIKAIATYGNDALYTLIAAEAHISATACIGRGCIVQRGVAIMADARIGQACKINLNATVHHDSVIGDYCTLAPGVQILGGVQIGNNVFIGAGAIVMPHIHIGDGVVIGAGSVVSRDVLAGQVVAGIPARSLKGKNGND